MGSSDWLGFVIVDKPTGMTSHGVVAAARKILGTKKIGHSGTLDPMATGLLLLGVGRATRLLRFVTRLPKEYVATARFGVATDTLDAQGEPVEKMSMEVTPGQVVEVLARFTGDFLQTPPMVSAVKMGGQRLYRLARQGVEVSRPPRPVTVYSLVLTEMTDGPFPDVTFRVACGSGFYVRVLADDIARELGGRAHLTALRRTQVGGVSTADSHTLEELSDLAGEGRLGEAIVPPDRVLSYLSAVAVAGEPARAVTHGNALVGWQNAGLRITPPNRMEIGGEEDPAPGSGGAARPLLSFADPGPYVRVVSEDRLLAVYRRQGEDLLPEVVLS